MKARAAALIAAALVLCGCTATPPAGPTEADLDARHAELLDQVWANTALGEVVDRPTVAVVATLDSSNWVKQVYICLDERGVAEFGLVFGADTGLMIVSADTREPMSDGEQLSFYLCAAQYRLDGIDLFGSEPLRSRAQLDYIYDYFTTWLVPCMIENDYTVPYAPTREEFVATHGRWNPFWATPDAQRAGLERVCGPELPAL